jgi:hypothetical protein
MPNSLGSIKTALQSSRGNVCAISAQIVEAVSVYSMAIAMKIRRRKRDSSAKPAGYSGKMFRFQVVI